MKYLTYRLGDGEPRVGALVGDGETLVDVARALAREDDAPQDLRSLITRDDLQEQLAAFLHAGGASDESLIRWDAVEILAPLRPGKIIGVGLNYAEHVEESSRSLDTARERPDRPVLFSKPATAVVGPGGAIVHNKDLTHELDWECELAVVIGRTARNVPTERAMDHVFGYSIINDISARDQRRSGQWFFSKGQDTFAPLGPVVVTADEIADPYTLRLSLAVNGVPKQDGSTSQMIFRIHELIADISSGMTLEPGDVIATGSPSGVGAGRVPPEYLWPGDVVEATIERIGALRNPVVAAS